MGLISRVSSRTYRKNIKKTKMTDYNTKLTENLKMKQQVSLVQSTGSNLSVQLVSQKKATKCNHEHLMDLAKTIATADSHVKATTTNRLKQIADQIKRLQNETQEILENAKRDKMLHQAACNIVKKPGQMYYLYEKTLDKEGKHTLAYDMQFTEEKDIGKDQETWDIIHNIYERTTN